MAASTLWFPTTAAARTLADLDHYSYGDRGLSLEQWRRLLRKPEAVVLAAGSSGYGVAAVTEGELWLLRCGVRPSERRQGLGRLLVSVLGERDRLRLRLWEQNRIGLEWAVAVGFRVQGIEGEWVQLLREPQ